MLDGKEKRIFTGWMFADSPGLNAVEHPVFDVWLTDCAQPRATARSARPQAGAAGPAPRPGRQHRRRRSPTATPTARAAACRGESDLRDHSSSARAGSA